MSSNEKEESPDIELAASQAISFEDMIGAPLHAMILAQSQSAQATLEFLDSLVDKDEKDGTVKLKTMNLIYDRMILDETTNKFETKKQKIRMPILSLVPVLFLNISEAEIEFNVNIITHSTKSKDSSKTKGQKQGIINSTNLFASYQESSRTRENVKSDLRVKIKIKQDMFPEGLAKYLSIIGNSIGVEDMPDESV